MDPENEEEGESKRIAGRFYSFPSSRIVRVTRASGGKDRHSKVLTSKGLRDRRVRLSVNTAIQFYDLQDRLGYDQPSKAVEWLLKAAASSIAELPPMSIPFLGTPRELSDYKRSEDGDRRQQVTKSSACSSNSENIREYSRSENRIKPRLRTKAKEKEKDKKESSHVLNPVFQPPSFTELLNGGGLSNSITPPTRGPNFFQKSPRHSWSSSTPMDYFSSGLEFTPDSIVSVAGDSNRGRGYNLNFTISSPGFNRGTLQSNSSLPHLQRFSPTDPSQTGFPVEHHHQFLSGFSMHTANKGTGKS